MPHIVFINPPSPFLMNDRGAPPLGILHIAAECDAMDMIVSLWDMTGDPTLAQALVQQDDYDISLPRQILAGVVQSYAEQDMPVDLFAITATSAQYSMAKRLLAVIRQDHPTIPVAIGGPHVSTLPNLAIDDGFDLVVTGEADHDFPRYIAQYGHEAGRPMILNCKAPTDLDALRVPLRELVDLPSYCANLTVGDGLTTTIIASRGCPWQCAYCVRTLGDKARVYRVRSPESVLAEMDSLYHDYGIARFVFVDDVFGLKKPWLIKFCELLEHRPYIWRCNIRSNYLYYDVLPRMYQAGCRCISFGFESADDRVLEQISKNSVELNARAIQACHDAGIHVKAYCIWGFRDDDRRSADALKEFVTTYQPDSLQLSTLIPLPGTPLFREAIELGWLPDYDQLYHSGVDGRGGMLRLPWQTDETFALRDELLEWLSTYNQSRAEHTAPWCVNKLSASTL
jgi:radical SAM superfamily enzyme YgiQ (UPF0313 family)